MNTVLLHFRIGVGMENKELLIIAVKILLKFVLYTYVKGSI